VKFTLTHPLATFNIQNENNTGYPLTICGITRRNGITFADFGVTVTIPPGYAAFIATNCTVPLVNNVQLIGGIALVTNNVPFDLKAAFIPVTTTIVKPLQIGDKIASLIVVPTQEAKTKQKRLTKTNNKSISATA
jgi:dUTPase